MEAALLRLKEELLTPESQDARMELNHFSDEIGCEKRLTKKSTFLPAFFCRAFLLPIFFYFLFCLF